MKSVFAESTVDALRKRQVALRPWQWLIVMGLALLSHDNWTLFNTPAPTAIDGSWSIGLGLARLLGLRFGTDIVFTYGPMGYLCSTRLPIAIDRWQMLLYDAWLLIQTGVVIYTAINHRFTIFRLLFILLCVLYIHDTGVGEPPFLFYYFTLFSLFLHLKSGRIFWLLYAFAIALFAFYVKASAGVTTFGSYLIYLFYWFFTRRERVGWLAGILAVNAAALLVSAWLLKTDLVPYVLNTLEIVESYNDAMAFFAGFAGPSLLAALTVGSLYVGVMLLFTWRHRRAMISRSGLDTLLIFLLAGFQLYVLYKHSFTRADPGHFALFFKYGILPVSLVILFTEFVWLKRAMLIPSVAVAIAGLILGPKFWEQRYGAPQFRQWRYYLADVFRPQSFRIQPDSTFPANWRQKLAPSTVDVLPVDIGLIYTENLAKNYRPRPVFQTYQVASRHLDSLNATFYQSARAPQFLIASHGATDNRYAMADEPLTKLTMMQHYEVTDQQGERLLLQRRARPLTIQTTQGPFHQALLNEPFDIPSDDTLQLMQIQVAYSLPGRLLRWFFQPAPLTLAIETMDGRRFQHKTAVPLLENGVLINRYITDVSQYRTFLQSQGGDGIPIRQIQIRNDRWQFCYKRAIRVQFNKLTIQ